MHTWSRPHLAHSPGPIILNRPCYAMRALLPWLSPLTLSTSPSKPYQETNFFLVLVIRRDKQPLSSCC